VDLENQRSVFFATPSSVNKKSKNYATLDFLVFTEKNMVPKKCYFGVLSTLV
jgi:hypothetical protein